MTVAALVPCRKDSERILEKNTRAFASFPGGLLELKLGQLLRCRTLDAVIVNSDDERAIQVATSLAELPARPRLEVVRRAPEFSRPQTSTEELIGYLADSSDADLILWTHVTSPLIGEATYDRAVEIYRDLDPHQHDSLMSVTRLQEFIWDAQGPKNYDPGSSRWPRTQDLPRWYLVNSGIFLCPRHLMQSRRDRIGERPYLLELDRWQGLDVDWPDDFTLAELAFQTFGAR